MACASDLAEGRARIVISMPVLNRQINITGICIGNGLHHLDFTDGEAPTGLALTTIFGDPNPSENVNRLADYINNSSALAADRTALNLVATTYNTIVTLELDADPSWCDQTIVVEHTNSGGVFDCGGDAGIHYYYPFAGKVSEVSCGCACTDCIDCGAYPSDAYVLRFLFHDNEPIGDREGADVAYVLKVGRGVTYIQNWDGGDIEVVGGFDVVGNLFRGNNPLALSYWDYGNNLDEFCAGWAAYYMDVWNRDGFLYSVSHVGDGLMEVVASRSAWAGRGVDLEAVGLGVSQNINVDGYGDHYAGTFVGLEPEIIAEQSCLGDDGPVTTDPPPVDDTDPPGPPPPYVVPDNTLTDCLESWTLQGCAFSVPGVQKLWVMDFRFLTRLCLDAVGVITAIEAPGGIWTRVNLRDAATAMTIDEQDDDDGLRYLVVVSCAVPRMNAANRRALTTLKSRRLCVVLQDQNGAYWFVGARPFPVRLRLAGGTGRRGDGANEYTFTLTGVERVPPREVAAAVITGDGYNPPLPESHDCADYVGAPMAPFTLNQLAPCELDTLETNDLDA